MDCSMPGLPVHHQLPEFTQTHVHWVRDVIQPSHPLSSPSSPILSLSQHQGLLKSVNSSYQVAKVLKYWSFSFSISPSSEYSGLVSFRIDWLDLLAVQGTPKSLLQHHSWKASILRCSAFFMVKENSVQLSSVAQLYPTLCDPMDCSTPGLPVHHQLPEFTQTHVHWFSDVIQPSHPLSSPYPPTFNPSQHQGLFQWVSSSHQVAQVLEFQLQHQSFQWICRTDFL